MAIDWTLADIRRISLVVCMHRIALDEGSKPCEQLLRCLNPTLKDVVMKEIFKLLEAGIIYPIPKNEWVSPIHMVPKKTSITIVKSDNGKLILLKCKMVGECA